jgi:subtilisin family serine protease
VIAGVATVLASAFAAPAAMAADPVSVPAEPQHPRPTGRAIVFSNRPATASAAIHRLELDTQTAIPELGAVAVDPPGGEGVGAVRRALRREPGVAAVEPEYRRFVRLAPDDPAFSAADPRAPFGDVYQWNLRQQGFARGWELSTGRRAKLAVIDTGVDGGNPDLGPRIVAAVDHDPTPGQGPATVDENGHGTHVSGLACATGNNGYGGASPGFACELIVEKSDLTDASIADSMVDATKRGADVINMSFGGPGRSKVIADAVKFAWKRDVIMVAAASNRNSKRQGIPAELLQPKESGPKLEKGKGLVVTAAGYDGSRAWFRPGHGKGISVAATGAATRTTPGIFSNFPANLTQLDTGVAFREPPCGCRTSFEGDDRFAYLDGTSMAAPQVAGAAALIRSRKPKIGAKKVIRKIKKKARGSNFRGSVGWGLLDAAAALRGVD